MLISMTLPYSNHNLIIYGVVNVPTSALQPPAVFLCWQSYLHEPAVVRLNVWKSRLIQQHSASCNCHQEFLAICPPFLENNWLHTSIPIYPGPSKTDTDVAITNTPKFDIMKPKNKLVVPIQTQKNIQVFNSTHTAVHTPQ